MQAAFVPQPNFSIKNHHLPKLFCKSPPALTSVELARVSKMQLVQWLLCRSAMSDPLNNNNSDLSGDLMRVVQTPSEGDWFSCQTSVSVALKMFLFKKKCVSGIERFKNLGSGKIELESEGCYCLFLLFLARPQG